MQLDSQPVSFALLAIKVQDFPLWWLTGTVMCSVPSCEHLVLLGWDLTFWDRACLPPLAGERKRNENPPQPHIMDVICKHRLYRSGILQPELENYIPCNGKRGLLEASC